MNALQMAGLLSPAEVTKARVEVLGRVYQTADRVLTGDRIEVKVTTDYSNPAPAWTNGTVITLNLARIDSATSVEDLIRLTGLNFHELGHAMFTPRQNTRLTRNVIAQGMFNAFNILEDQRLETFLTVMYPSTVPYFTATIMKFCAQNKQAWEGNFLLTYGRKYLPKKVRDEFRKRFTRPDLIAEASAVIDAYRQCVFPRDDHEGLDLIVRFHKVLMEYGKTPQDPNGHSANGRPKIDSGRAVSQSDQEEAVDNIADWDDYYDDDDDDAANDAPDDNDGEGTESDDDESESGSGKGGKDDDTDEDGDEDGTGNGDGDETDDDGEGDEGDDDEGNGEGEADSNEAAPPTTYDSEDGETGNTTPGHGAGNTAPEPPPLSDDDLEDLLNAKAEEAQSLPEVQEDAKRKQSTIIKGDGKVDTHFPDASTKRQPPDAAHVATVRRLVKEFQQLQSDADPGYKVRQSSGRVNIQRVITEGVDFDTMFDEWDEGQQNATDIEAVIIVDVSTSMRDKTIETSMALWAIKRALEEVDATVTVLAFSAVGVAGGQPATYLLYGRDQSVEKTSVKVFNVVGGTQPSEAILESMRIFNASRRTHKLFIAITDGAWFAGNVMDGLDNDEAIERMNAYGVTTALAYIGHLNDEQVRNNGYGHNCTIIRAIDRPEHLVGWAREVVVNVARKRRTR